MLPNRRILLTGASGFVGSNLEPMLDRVNCEVLTPGHDEYDLLEQEHVRRLLRCTRPHVVFHLAALSGGIEANRRYPADFCYQNLIMNTVMLHESWQAGVEKYIALIGGCSYPSSAHSPMSEDQLWNGYPQPESAPYSVAKKMTVTLAEAYRRQHGFDCIVLIPGNLYGPHDNFDHTNSHVIPALIRRFLEAVRNGEREVVIWGSGQPVRDFVYVRDACRVIVKAAESYSGSDVINISSGTAVSIRELAELVAELTEFSGEIVWDTSKPDGQMVKVFDVKRMEDALKLRCETSLRDGLRQTVDWLKENWSTARLDVPVQSARQEWRRQ